MILAPPCVVLVSFGPPYFAVPNPSCHLLLHHVKEAPLVAYSKIFDTAFVNFASLIKKHCYLGNCGVCLAISSSNVICAVKGDLFRGMDEGLKWGYFVLLMCSFTSGVYSFLLFVE
ncbi:hypothetical protein U1Q18_000222 [Sarracenia purpurea var. burkii]